MSAQRSHVSSGINPALMSAAKIRHPRHSAKTDSRIAATTSSAVRTSAAVSAPKPSASSAAADVSAAPIPCAKRFGGPATYFGADTAADVLTALLVVAAILESVFALCLGCQVFAVLMRLGVVPEATCERCADIWARPPQPEASRL